MLRIDMVAKCTGTAVFGIDLRMPGMVYATVRTNPRLGGGMKGYDASAAANSRGVLKIVPITGGVGVIADNTWRAFKAANLIKFDWGPAPYPPIDGGDVRDGGGLLHSSSPGQPVQERG